LDTPASRESGRLAEAGADVIITSTAEMEDALLLGRNYARTSGLVSRH
jgi:hypothetical protein